MDTTMNNSTNVKFIQLVHIADVKSDSDQYLCGLASDGSILYTSLHDLEAGWKQIDTPFKVVQLPIPEAPVVVSPPVHVDNFTSVESQRRKPVLMFLHESYPKGRPNIGSTPLYDKYTSWCRKNKEVRVSIITFGRTMRMVPGVGSWKYKGLIHYGIKPLAAFTDWQAIDLEIQCRPSS
jgi:hypothetical protein